jgi:hypothetical protein
MPKKARSWLRHDPLPNLPRFRRSRCSFSIISTLMECSSDPGGDEPPDATRYERFKVHAKEFIEATPEEHVK